MTMAAPKLVSQEQVDFRADKDGTKIDMDESEEAAQIQQMLNDMQREEMANAHIDDGHLD